MKPITFYALRIERYETTELAQENHYNLVPVSITDDRCELHCDHCNGKLLKYMKSVSGTESLFQACKDFAEKYVKVVFISSGCDASGKVSLADFY